MTDEGALDVAFDTLERDVTRLLGARASGGPAAIAALAARRRRRHHFVVGLGLAGVLALAAVIRVTATRNRSPARSRGWGRDVRGGHSAT
ncbi:hypothetical protein [Embleya sp. NBC_00896]|uniref:hypothetical protein n=1 Tax=Embleya sp. NBC_00896 TaxID=2975961 RepID=UPI00386B4865|nr:hypothetical protein OG928_10995 [Embleya sp. NBC_00896]